MIMLLLQENNIQLNNLKYDSKRLKMKIKWIGKGIKEKGIDENGNIIIECDKNYFRPLDVNTLLGDARKARKN